MPPPPPPVVGVGGVGVVGVVGVVGGGGFACVDEFPALVFLPPTNGPNIMQVENKETLPDVILPLLFIKPDNPNPIPAHINGPWPPLFIKAAPPFEIKNPLAQ